MSARIPILRLRVSFSYCSEAREQPNTKPAAGSDAQSMTGGTHGGTLHDLCAAGGPHWEG